jgi:4-diphosphocytidyl-2-C-methyl-D-erythritol kinase
MNQITVSAPAKVNIGLRVLNQQTDGYHNLHTIFQELAYHDTITLIKRPQGWKFTSSVPWVPADETNLCIQAYLLMKERFPSLPGVELVLQKHIPAQSGLGGGSSDGAAVLKGLNRLFALELTDEVLEELGRELGADVPFFIRGGTQLGEGIGDRLTPLPVGISGTYLLVIPEISIPTRWAYEALKKPLETPGEKPNFADLLKRDPIPFPLFENDFEQVVFSAHPEIGLVKDQLLRQGAYFASLSGSGSTVFGIFADDTRAKRAQAHFSPQYQTVLTHPVFS